MRSAQVASVLAAFLIAAAPAPASNQPPPGYQGDCTDAGCHGQLGKWTVVHGPVASGSCDACHEPAGDKGHKCSLTAEGGDLCTECHDEFSGKVEHSPASEGQCTVCHDPQARPRSC
ncbi:MAG: cytochrome c3 family protein [Planctomycetota bacterium]|jgi:predicted CXXCH cytochrome family protein